MSENRQAFHEVREINILLTGFVVLAKLRGRFFCIERSGAGESPQILHEEDLEIRDLLSQFMVGDHLGAWIHIVNAIQAI